LCLQNPEGGSTLMIQPGHKITIEVLEDNDE